MPRGISVLLINTEDARGDDRRRDGSQLLHSERLREGVKASGQPSPDRRACMHPSLAYARDVAA